MTSRKQPPQDLLERIRGEYLEMPGLRLKPEHVRRLCGVDATVCQMALDSLVDAKFLSANSDGTYARLTGGEVTRARVSRGDLTAEAPLDKAS